MATYTKNLPLPTGAYRINSKTHDYWIVDVNGNIIGQTGASNQDTYFVPYPTTTAGIAALNAQYTSSNPPVDTKTQYVDISVSPYVTYGWNGVAYAVSGGGGTSTPVTSAVSTNRNLTSADNGATLDCTVALTLTIPAGLAVGFTVVVIPPDTGNVSIASAGGVLLNGAITTLARSATNIAISVIGRSTINAYKVTGI